ncbi:substrate-binding periplasmic protein [Amycolatopsis jejuensis]|uniref:substrate-binding periplasmic protein n=1 Tax=Amycolatopsis jejuensis TaxID=330084 RepID=UPI0005265CFF|nr:transporter substrate-binding domain-containing protein [Amycolatopsis jejuensis]
MRKVICLLVAPLFLAACGSSPQAATDASGCKPLHTFTTLKKGVLTVAGTTLPPFGNVTKEGISGVDGEILTKFAAAECLTIEPTPTSAAATIPSVQSRRADVAMGDWTRTAARAEIVALSDPTYIDQMALVSQEGFSEVSKIKGKAVGTVNGYMWVDSLRTYLGELRVYPSNVQMYADLKAGRLDFAIDSFGAATVSMKDTPYTVKVATPDAAVPATENGSQTAFPVSKAEPELLAALNAHIAKIKADGTLANLLVANGLPASAANTGGPRLIS